MSDLPVTCGICKEQFTTEKGLVRMGGVYVHKRNGFNRIYSNRPHKLVHKCKERELQGNE